MRLICSYGAYDNIYIADSTYAPLYQQGENLSAENPAIPLFGRAITAQPGVIGSLTLIYNATKLPIPVNANSQYTVDFWFFFNDLAITKAKSKAQTIGSLITINSAGNLVIRLCDNYTVTVNSKSVTYKPVCTWTAKDYVNKPHHFAITCKMEDGYATSRAYLDGNYITWAPRKQIKPFPFNKTFTFSEYVAFNKIRWFNRVFWESDFEPPKPTDYL